MSVPTRRLERLTGHLRALPSSSDRAEPALVSKLFAGRIRFDGQVVVVSGGGHGIGRAICHAFANLGALVHTCDLSAANLAETAKGFPDRIFTRVVDLTDRKAAARFIENVLNDDRSFRRPIFALINNAGGVAGQGPKPLEEVKDEDFDKIFAVNLGAALALSRAAVTSMKKAKQGRIVIISSGAGLQASLTGIQAYCAAKHAEIGLTRQLAHELGPFNITTNSVAPGFVRSNPASEKQYQLMGADGQKALVESIAMKRLGTAEDIANACVFFCSELGSFVNGQVLQVDGGR